MRSLIAQMKFIPHILIILSVISFSLLALAGNANAGTSRTAYAHVLGDGKLDKSNSVNVVKFESSPSGLYCFKLAFSPKNAVATIADDPTAQQGLAIIEVAVPPT